MYRALVSFSGVISMAQNEVREITDKNLIKDLKKAGYIEEVKSTSSSELKKENETLKAELETLKAELETLKASDNEKTDEENKNSDNEKTDENK